MQDRESHQLTIKRDGLTRLKKSVDEGEVALTEMRCGLADTEQKVTLLQTRREQAEVESQTLVLVSATTTNADTVAEHAGSNQVSPSFNRLESLKVIHDANAKAAAPTAAPIAKPETQTIEASKVVIEIQK